MVALPRGALLPANTALQEKWSSMQALVGAPVPIFNTFDATVCLGALLCDGPPPMQTHKPP